jgi:aryl-phospho-beta-D-glucosidase BglC (GH1 family)
MPDPGELLDLLYSAHRNVDAMFAEIRDWLATDASPVLIAETAPDGAVRLRWAGGGPYGRPAGSNRRVWFQRPDRTRVEVMNAATMVRAGVRDGTAWWRWDQNNGETAGDLTQGAGLPPLLDLTLLRPASLLHTMWFEVTGTGSRAGRNVLKATGTPREDPDGTGAV